MFRKIHNWLKACPKFIHLCWMFTWLGLSIPPYFIGGTGDIWEIGFRICTAPGDNSDPDDTGTHTWLASGVDATGIEKGQEIFLRFCMQEVSSADVNNGVYELRYDIGDTPATGTKVTTSTGVVRIVNDPEDAVADFAVTNESLIGGTGSQENGQHIDASDQTGKIDIGADNHAEIQFCVAFQADADDEEEYFFFLWKDGAPVDTYTATASVTTAAAPEGGPRGPLGQPFKGPFEGPIS